MSHTVLQELFERYCGRPVESMAELPGSGSHRRYFRIRGGELSLMGVLGTDLEENRAFIGFSRHFKEKGINVPEVLAVSEDGMAYLQEDLGDTILFNALTKGRESGSYSEEDFELCRRTIEQLPRLQFKGAEGLDWDLCYPQKSFCAQMVDFDLNYFKYCFLKGTGLEFNEVLLQEDFEKLKADLLEDDTDTFLHRDFQSRNVLIKDGEPYIIDYQGGCRGPIYYDVVSFISQARSHFPEEMRKRLLESYLQALRQYTEVDEKRFRDRLRLFYLFRTMQVLGAYGFRGYIEKKPHFLASVPFAIENLRGILKTPFIEYPYLNETLNRVVTMPQPAAPLNDGVLEVRIFSFSYKKGIPADNTTNGGGYVFDCRAVHNPGKYEYYRQFNGNDPEVIKFLEDDGEVFHFLDNVYGLVDAHVKRFQERGFTQLQVCFGCTGGQHRSVYCAEHLARHLKERFDLRVRLVHREMGIEKVL